MLESPNPVQLQKVQENNITNTAYACLSKASYIRLYIQICAACYESKPAPCRIMLFMDKITEVSIDVILITATLLDMMLWL